MRDLLLYLSGTYNNRYTLGGKKKFLNAFSKAFREMGYKVELIKTRVNKKSLTNLCVGNIKAAKVILVCPFDTPKIALLPKYRFYPFNYKKNVRIDSFNHIIEIIFSVLSLIGCYNIMINYNKFNPILASIGILFLIFLFFVLNIGIPAPYSFNRSTAAVTLCYSLAEELHNDDLALIFCDRSVSSYEGINEAKDLIKDNHAGGQVIYLDCISDGESLYIAHSKKCSSEAKKIINIDRSLSFVDYIVDEEKIPHSPLKVFEKGIFIGCGSANGEDIVVYKTRGFSDCQCNIEQLEKIKNILIEYIGTRKIK